MNGRLCYDDSSGNYNCEDSSGVVYVIASHALLPMCNDFRVLNFDPLLSRVHYPIVFSILCRQQQENSDSESCNQSGQKVKTLWNKDNSF